MSEDFSLWVVELRRFVTFCKIAPYINSLTYLLTYLPLHCQLHWLKASEWIDYKLAVFAYKCLHGTAASHLLINSACWQTLAHNVDFVQHRHHHWSFAVCNCERSVTKISQSSQLIFGTVYHITQHLHCLCLHSAVVWRLISFSAAFCDYVLSSLSSDLISFGHVNRSS